MDQAEDSTFDMFNNFYSFKEAFNPIVYFVCLLF